MTSSCGQVLQNVGHDLDQNRLTLIVSLKEFYENINFEKVVRQQISMLNFPACTEINFKTVTIKYGVCSYIYPLVARHKALESHCRCISDCSCRSLVIVFTVCYSDKRLVI